MKIPDDTHLGELKTAVNFVEEELLNKNCLQNRALVLKQAILNGLFNQRNRQE